jgi:tRNA threonylcarbamoyladenosine biosynthesis protein TsaE
VTTRGDPRRDAPTAAVEIEARSADETREVGRRLAGVLVAGDVVVLSGDLGAGKTTFAQGIGAGLRVRGDVTSPTFVISRVHPSLVSGPPLVHVDAYRLHGAAELDDLDLDETLDDAVTVVEWGDGLADTLAPDRLRVHLVRRRGGDAPDGTTGGGLDGDEPRTISVQPAGERWAEVPLSRLLGEAPDSCW